MHGYRCSGSLDVAVGNLGKNDRIFGKKVLMPNPGLMMQSIPSTPPLKRPIMPPASFFAFFFDRAFFVSLLFCTVTVVFYRFFLPCVFLFNREGSEGPALHPEAKMATEKNCLATSHHTPPNVPTALHNSNFFSRAVQKLPLIWVGN